MAEDKLQFGLSLDLDQAEWMKDWARMEKQIQKTIDESKFTIKISGAEGLDAIKKQLQEIQQIQNASMKPLTSYQAGKLEIARQTAATVAQARANEINARSQERVAKMSLQTQKAQLSLNKVLNNTTTGVKAQTSAFQTQLGIMNGMKQFMNSYVSILGAYRLVDNIRQITSEFELQRVALRAITQDAQFADQLFSKIKATAVASPFSTKELVTYTKQLAAYRIENEELYDTMQMLADISAGIGVSMDRLILAYGQVKAASVLRGTELRQFTEAGIPLVDELAKKFSQLRGEVVSTGEVFDLISTRQVPFQMIADIFREMTSEGGRFYEMQKKQSESLYGVFENLKDAVQISFDEIGQSNRGLLMAAGKTATALARNLRAILDVLTPLIASWGTYKIALLLANNAQKGLLASTTLLSKANAALIASENKLTVSRTASLRLLAKANAANNLYVASLTKASLANNVFTKGLYAIKAALIANPITAILSAATLAITGFFTVLSRNREKLASVDEATKRVTATFDDLKTTAEEDVNLKGYESAVNKLKESEKIINSARFAYEDLGKVYPDLAEKFKSEEEWNKAIQQSYTDRKETIEDLKESMPEYFSYLDSEESSVKDLEKGYNDLDLSIRQAIKSGLELRKTELLSKESDLEKKVGSGWQKFLYGKDNKFFWIDSKALAQLKGVQNELAAIDEQLDGLDKSISDSTIALSEWRQNYKDLVKEGKIDDEQLAMLDFSKAAEDANRQLQELDTKIADLENVPELLLTQDLADSLSQMKTLRDSTNQWLEMYKQLKKEESGNEASNALKAELSLVEQIYKRYGELRKLMSEASAKQSIKNIYGGLTDIDFLSPSEYRRKLEEIARKAEAAGDTDLALKIKLKIQDIDLTEAKNQLEGALSELSSRITKQQNATDFFEKILGLTGDTELSTKLTLSVTGFDMESGEDIRGLMAQQIADIMTMDPIRAEIPAEFDLAADFSTDDLQEAINKGKISVAQIQQLIDSLPDSLELKSRLQSALDSFVGYNKQQMEELLGVVGKYGDINDQLKILQDKLVQDQKKVLSAVKPQDMMDIDWNAWISSSLAALQNQFDQDVAKLNFSELQKKFANELSNLDATTVAVLDKIMSELQGILSAGNLDANTMKTVLELIEKIRDVKIDKQPLIEFGEAWKDLVKAIKDGDDAAKAEAFDALSKSADAMVQKYQRVESAINGIIDTATGVADALGLTFSDETQEAIEAFQSGVSLATTALTALAAIILVIEAELWPVLVVALALGAAFAVFNWISNIKTRNAEREIERLEQSLRKLELAFEDLQEAQKDLVGSDWAKNLLAQIENLRKQAADYQAQLRAEKSKGKKADEDALQDYEDSYRDAINEIADLQRDLFEEMTGSGKTDIISDLANAAVEAYLTFSDATENMKESFRDMIQNMVAQSVLARVIFNRLRPIFEAIDAAFKDDGEMSNAEGQNISNLMQGVLETLPEELENILSQFGWLEDWRSPSDDGDLTGIAKGISQASEETVLTLAGYANSILYYQVWIKNDVAAIRAILEGKAAAVSPMDGKGGINVGQLITLQQQSVAHLQAISNNTAQTAQELKALNDKVDSIISAPGSNARKMVNTRLRS